MARAWRWFIDWLHALFTSPRKDTKATITKID